MRKLFAFFKRSSSPPQRGRSKEQRPSSPTSAGGLADRRTQTRNTSNPTPLSASRSAETLPCLHSPTHSPLFSSTPALVQNPSSASPLPAHSPSSHRPPSPPTSTLPLSDASISSNTPNPPPVITRTSTSPSHSSRPSTASSRTVSTRSTTPRIRLDRNASPARPETQNNVAPFISDPTLLAPTAIDRSNLAPERRGSYIPGGMNRSYIPGVTGRNFLPGTGDVNTSPRMGMGPGMGLEGITSSPRSRPSTAGSISSRREREKRQSSRRRASVSSIVVEASEPGPFTPFARSGAAKWMARVNNFE